MILIIAITFKDDNFFKATIKQEFRINTNGDTLDGI